MIVGLTGGIASGKSTVAAMLVERGAALVDCDRLAHEALEPGQAAYSEVLARFGVDLAGPDGAIDRRRLGAIVFHDASARQDLERIVHPAVELAARREIDQWRGRGSRVIILDAPLLIEAGFLGLVDRLIVVTVDRHTQMERLVARDGFQRRDAEARIDSQMPLSEKVRYADYVIDNNRGLDSTRAQVDKVWEDILNGEEDRTDRARRKKGRDDRVREDAP